MSFLQWLNLHLPEPLYSSTIVFIYFVNREPILLLRIDRISGRQLIVSYTLNILGCPKLHHVGGRMSLCNECGQVMNLGWVACPYCGWQIENMFNSNLSILELAEQRSGGNCSGSCRSKKRELKSKCCKKYKKKSKSFCKSCPKDATTQHVLKASMLGELLH